MATDRMRLIVIIATVVWGLLLFASLGACVIAGMLADSGNEKMLRWFRAQITLPISLIAGLLVPWICWWLGWHRAAAICCALPVPHLLWLIYVIGNAPK